MCVPNYLSCSWLFDDIVWRQCVVVWATEFARRYSGQGIVCTSLNPGAPSSQACHALDLLTSKSAGNLKTDLQWHLGCIQKPLTVGSFSQLRHVFCISFIYTLHRIWYCILFHMGLLLSSMPGPRLKGSTLMARYNSFLLAFWHECTQLFCNAVPHSLGQTWWGPCRNTRPTNRPRPLGLVGGADSERLKLKFCDSGSSNTACFGCPNVMCIAYFLPIYLPMRCGWTTINIVNGS